MLPSEPFAELLSLLANAGGLDYARAGLKALSYLGALYAAGAFFFLLAFPEVTGGAVRDTVRRAALWAVAAALAGAALIPLRAAFLGGAPSMATDPALLEMVAQTALGESAALRAAGAAAIVAATLAYRSIGRPALLLGALGGGALLFGLTTIGHSAAARPVGVWQALLLGHLFVAAVWLGALYPLQRICERDAADEVAPIEVAPIMERFGRIGAQILFVLAGLGAAIAAALIGSLQALWSGAYGQFFLIKLAAVALLLLLAALHRFVLTPRLANDPLSIGTLKASIGVERWVAALVVIATAGLTSFTGPH